MKLKTIATLAVASLLVPAFAFAQVDVNASAGTKVRAAGLSAGASTTISATAMATAKSRADQEIDRRIASLNALTTRVGGMTRVSEQFKTQLNATIQAQISALTTLKATIDADTDGAALKSDIKSIATSYRVYMLVLPLSRISAAADRAVNIATMESALSAKLKTRIDAAGLAGKDTSALNASLADIASNTTAAVASAQAAVSLSASLQPDQGDKTVEAANTKALQTARKDIQSAQQDLVQARKDIESIMQGLKALGASANASSSAQVH